MIFYGELLTEHQRQIYEDVVFHDLSRQRDCQRTGNQPSGGSRFGRRCDRILEEYEAKLQLVAKFIKIRDKVRQIQAAADGYLETGDRAQIETIRRLSGEISSTL